MTPANTTVTVAGLARHLNLSPTTVSFVLNGLAKQHGIADATVKRVRRAARECNYVPNALARSLRHQKSGIIGVVFPHLRNDWAHYIMDGMYGILEEAGLVPFIANHRDNPEQEARELDLLIQRRAEGILCNPLAASLAAYRRVCAAGIPLVFFGDTLKTLPNASFAAWDPAEVGLAVQHLVDTGRRRIAYVGARDQRQIAQARDEAVRRTLEMNRIPIHPEWFLLTRPTDVLEQKIQAWFQGRRTRPDAIFTLYDDAAFITADILESMGIRVPDEVALATLGDSKLAGPRGYDLTTVSAPVREEGRQAATILVQLLRSKKRDPVHRFVQGGKLIARGSSARPGTSLASTTRTA